MTQKATDFSVRFDINRQDGYDKIPRLITEVLATLKAIKTIPEHERRFDNTAAVLIEKSASLFELWSLLSHYQKVLNDDDLREKHAAAQEQLTELDNTLSFDKELMALYDNLLQSTELTADQRLYLEYELKDFRLCGLDKPQEVQERLKQINLRLGALSLSFQNNVLDSTYQWLSVLEKDELSGLSHGALEYFKEIFQENQKALAARYPKLQQGGYAINLSQPCLQAILSQADSQILRERVFRAVSAQCSPFDEVASKFDNTAIVKEILSLRREMATLLGYNSYQEMKLETRFAKEPGDIESLYEQAITLLRPAAEKEFEQIQLLALETDGISKLEPWDVSYYTDKWRKHHMQLDPEELRAFFPLKRVLSTMLEIFEGVFTLSITVNNNSSKWHPDVFSLEISENGQLIGEIYCDLFARPQKDQGAWMDDYRSAYQRADGRLVPAVAFLCCNFRPGEPALLLFDEVLTLFHEFGHCLHHILSRRTIEPISGLSRVPWDIVELPSQLFEKWCYEPFWLSQMSTDPITGVGLDEHQKQALMKEQTVLSGLFYLRQVQLGFFDWHLHGSEEKKPVLFWHEVLEKIAVTPRYADSQFPLTFGHIFNGGYSAGYYSYLWADLYVAQVFERFKQYPSMTQAGQAFRQHFMGLAAPFDLKEQLEQHFLQSPQNIEPFMRSIGYEHLLTLK